MRLEITVSPYNPTTSFLPSLVGGRPSTHSPLHAASLPPQFIVYFNQHVLPYLRAAQDLEANTQSIYDEFLRINNGVLVATDDATLSPALRSLQTQILEADLSTTLLDKMPFILSPVIARVSNKSLTNPSEIDLQQLKISAAAGWAEAATVLSDYYRSGDQPNFLEAAAWLLIGSRYNDTPNSRRLAELFSGISTRDAAVTTLLRNLARQILVHLTQESMGAKRMNQQHLAATKRLYLVSLERNEFLEALVTYILGERGSDNKQQTEETAKFIFQVLSEKKSQRRTASRWPQDKVRAESIKKALTETIAKLFGHEEHWKFPQPVSSLINYCLWLGAHQGQINRMLGLDENAPLEIDLQDTAVSLDPDFGNQGEIIGYLNQHPNCGITLEKQEPTPECNAVKSIKIDYTKLRAHCNLLSSDQEETILLLTQIPQEDLASLFETLTNYRSRGTRFFGLRSSSETTQILTTLQENSTPETQRQTLENYLRTCQNPRGFYQHVKETLKQQTQKNAGTTLALR